MNNKNKTTQNKIEILTFNNFNLFRISRLEIRI